MGAEPVCRKLEMFPSVAGKLRWIGREEMRSVSLTRRELLVAHRQDQLGKMWEIGYARLTAGAKLLSTL